jgi:hypothetical protein
MAKIDKITPVEFIETTSTKLTGVQEEHPGAFIHVNDENGDDTLYIGEDQVTDKFNVGDSNLNSPTRKIGGLNASTIGQLKEKSMSEILLDILKPDVVEPTISTNASISISYSGSKLIEVGSVLPSKQNITSTVKDGKWSDNTPYAGGHSDVVLSMSPDKWGQQSEEGVYTITGSVTFEEGGIPKDNFGTSYPNKKYNGGTKTSLPIKITSVYPIYVNDEFDITTMRGHLVDYLNGSVILQVSIPDEIDGTDDKFKVYLPSIFSVFEVKQYNPLTGKYDIPIEMELIEGETSKYIRTNDVSDTLGSTTYEIKLSK